MSLKKSKLALVLMFFSIFVIIDTNIDANVNESQVTKSVRVVGNADELNQALQDPTNSIISLSEDISLSKDIKSSLMNVSILGNGNTIFSGKYSISFTSKKAVISFEDVVIKSSAPAGTRTIYLDNNSVLTLKDVTFTGKDLVYSYNSKVNVENLSFNGNNFLYDWAGQVIFSGKNNMTGTTLLEIGSFTLEENATVISNASTRFALQKYGDILLKQNSTLKLDSQRYGIYNDGETKVHLEKGANLDFVTRFAVNSGAIPFKSVKLDDGARFNAVNVDNAFSVTIFKVNKSIEVGKGAQFNIINKAKNPTNVLWMTNLYASIVLQKGSNFDIANTAGNNSVYMEGIWSSTMSFEGAKIEGWHVKGKPSVTGPASEKYENMTGTASWFLGKTKSKKSNNSTFDKYWGGKSGSKPVSPYSRIAVTGLTPELTLGADNITYERGSEKSAAEFLVDVDAKSNIDYIPITSNFDEVVDMNTVGEYMVTVQQQNVEAIVKVTIVDTTAPVITADDFHLYNVVGMGITKTEEDFLRDINASTDDGSPITTDFDIVDLNEVGFYEVTLTATDDSMNTDSKTVVVVVTHPNKTVIGNEAILYADDFNISLKDLRGLTVDQVKDKVNTNAISFDIKKGINLFDSINVNEKQLRAIQLSRVPQTLPVTLSVEYNGELIEKVVLVTITE